MSPLPEAPRGRAALPGVALGSARAVSLAVALLTFAAAPAAAEMYKYIDSKGRMHFTQDIGQVPPEYRSQVERKELKKDISITGEGRGSGGAAERATEMRDRKRRLEQQAEQRARSQRARTRPAAIPPQFRNRLEGAPEPRKYDKDCSNQYRTGRCRKVLRPEWRSWDRANGGNNGKAVTRRSVGDP
jgi:hypothetical protein